MLLENSPFLSLFLSLPTLFDWFFFPFFVPSILWTKLLEITKVWVAASQLLDITDCSRNWDAFFSSMKRVVMTFSSKK
jgi:hypothetical protein